MSLSEQWRSVMLDRQNNRMALRGQERQRQIDLAEARATARTEGLAEGKAEGLAEGLAGGLEKGHAEGHAEGATESKLEIARKMKKAGRPFSEIAEFTGLSLETIKQI
jgi:predicted transposase/invertase (TIGR01784 family)